MRWCEVCGSASCCLTDSAVFMGLTDEEIAAQLMQLDDDSNDDFIVHQHDDSEPEEDESCGIVANTALELADEANIPSLPSTHRHTQPPRRKDILSLDAALTEDNYDSITLPTEKMVSTVILSKKN